MKVPLKLGKMNLVYGLQIIKSITLPVVHLGDVNF